MRTHGGKYCIQLGEEIERDQNGQINAILMKRVLVRLKDSDCGMFHEVYLLHGETHHVPVHDGCVRELATQLPATPL